MSLRRIALLICCVAVSTASFVILDFWSARNGPLGKRFERQWRADIRQLEDSGKLPKPWSDLREVVIIGGTPETKKMLRQLNHHPVKTKNDGQHRMEVLIVAWEEEGVQGVLVQYNIEEVESKENVYELGRTLILNRPNLLEEFRWLSGL